MSKPTYWAIGAALAVAIVWIAVRMNAPPPAGTPTDASAAAPSAMPATSQTESVPTAESNRPGDTGTPTAPGASVSTATGNLQMPAADRALPIDVTPGFELLNTKASSLKDTNPTKALLLRHEELQDQPRDPSWSDRMEAALRKGIQDSLTARGFDTQRVELRVVECRSTGCEIQAIGYVEDQLKQGVDIQTIVPALLMGPLNGELDNLHGSMSSLPDGRLSYIFLLDRRGT